jgi:hypothetical protein
MSLEQQLRKYCKVISRKDKFALHRQWLSIKQYDTKIYTDFINRIYTSVTCPTIECKLIYKNYHALLNLKNTLCELGFDKHCNFESAYIAYTAIMMIHLVNNFISSVEQIDNMIKSLTSYIMLYILVDHTLDSDSSKLQLFKEEFNKTISSSEDNMSNHFEVINYYLKDLMQNNPNSIKHIIDVAEIEFKSVKEQKTQSHDLLEMCYLKGEKSTIAGCSIINNGLVPEGADLLGRLAQLYDDMVDVDDDIKDNINTFATNCVDVYGNIDQCITLFLTIFDNLPVQYETIKPMILYMMSTHLLNNRYISIETRLILRKYSFLFYTGSY